jgi:hypothetical protein
MSYEKTIMNFSLIRFSDKRILREYRMQLQQYLDKTTKSKESEGWCVSEY